ncbi:MAG: MFS transporter [Thermomicrobiales bacterium]|nr:MFS transporter [Thermomicrobiales bacterium]
MSRPFNRFAAPFAPLAELDRSARRSIAAALMAVFIGALDLTVIATLLPGIVGDLQINTADIDRYVWIVNGYLLAYVVSIPIVGRASDLVGRQAAFAGSLAIFLVGSIWCAVAPSMGWLIAGRAVQGVGGGALLPVAMALVGDLLPAHRRAAALGLVGAVDTLGWVLGPLWGALIVSVAGTHAAWRWVFILNLPLGLIAFLAIRRTTSYRRVTRPGHIQWRRRLDLVGVMLLSICLLAINLGLSAGGEVGGAPTGGRALGGTRNPLSEYTFRLIAVGIVFGAIFVWWERRVKYPLLPLRLFTRRRFSWAILANFMAGASLIVAMVDVPVVVTLVVDPAQISTVTALMMAPFTLLMAILSLGGGMLVARQGERPVAIAGLILVAIGYAALWLGLHSGDYVGMTPGLALAGAGFGMVVAPIGATVIDAAPPEERGIAAGLTLVFRLLGMTVSISALTSLGVARLQTLVGDLEAIVQLPGETTAEFFARQSEFLYTTVIPLTLQVVRETFLLAGVIALVAIVPVWAMGERRAGASD